jgi:hypothetical protein
LVVECADAGGGVDGPKKIGEEWITGDNHAVTALLPQEKFQQPLGITAVQSDIRAFVRKDGRWEHGHGTIATLQGEGEVLRVAGFFNQRPVGAIPERGRYELRVENGPELRGNIELIWDI